MINSILAVFTIIVGISSVLVKHHNYQLKRQLAQLRSQNIDIQQANQFLEAEHIHLHSQAHRLIKELKNYRPIIKNDFMETGTRDI